MSKTWFGISSLISKCSDPQYTWDRHSSEEYALMASNCQWQIIANTCESTDTLHQCLMLLLVSAGNTPGQNYKFSNWTATTLPSPDACEATMRVKTRIQLNIPLITAQCALPKTATQEVFSFRRKFMASEASETSKGRVKLRAWLSPLRQGHNLVLKASLLNISLKYSFSLSSCILLFKENLKAKRELRRRLSGKSNKGLNSLCFMPCSTCL